MFENEIMKLWYEGKISGEMHMGIGEEAINVGICTYLKEGDAIATDHRSTSPFFLRGVDPVKIILELLGSPSGLCKGNGGHMHLFSKEYLISSSGIVGSSGPAAVGYALALDYKKTDNISVAFFGEGSMNQGMLLESMNLAAVWKLPVLFICKDNNWAITTQSNQVTGGNLITRAEGMGIEGEEVDGLDGEKMLECADRIIKHMRKKPAPYFVHAKCVHKEGHFLGDPLLRFFNKDLEPAVDIKNLIKTAGERKGVWIGKKLVNLTLLTSLINKSREQKKSKLDPLSIIEKHFREENEQLEAIQSKVNVEINNIIVKALEIYKQEENQ